MSSRAKLILILSVVLVMAFVSTSVLTYVVSSDLYRISTADGPRTVNEILAEDDMRMYEEEGLHPSSQLYAYALLLALLTTSLNSGSFAT
ncbi:hypothetical protein KAT59_08020 [Candidatus Bipolaricaulota bacterium]|jgi:hypothetical protein|nr:hypothetical protein [Candidatus Bipolaricaulota bacterium]